MQEKTFGIGITLVIASIITIAIFSFRQTRKVNDVSSRIDYTRSVLLQLSDLYNTVIEHAGAARNYSLNGKEEEIKSMQSTASALLLKLELLKTLVKKNPGQQIQSDSLGKYINKRIEFSNQLITEGKEKGSEAAAALYQTGTGRDYNNMVLSIIQKMQTDELSTLQLDEYRNTDSIKQLSNYLLGLLAFILALTIILVQKSRLDIAARKRTAEQLKKFNEVLEEQVKIKTAGIRESEEKLQEADKNLRQVLSSTAENFYVIDKSYHVTLINKAAQRNLMKAWGKPVNVGTPILDFIPDESDEPIRSSFAKVFAGEKVEYELHLSIEGLPTWILVSYIPVVDENGTITGANVVTKDITERKKAEEAIRKSEERYRALIEQASDAIMITDQKGNFIDVNTSFCNQFGYTKEELIGFNISKVIDPEQLKNDPIRFDLLLAGQPVFKERRMMPKNGGIIEVEANVKMLPDGRMLAIARDITERKKAAEEKERVRYLLNERVKELTTLYRAGQILQAEHQSVQTVLQEIVLILPGGWQYPDITAARIVLGESEFTTPNYFSGVHKQNAGFQIPDGTTGIVEVVYLEERPAETEGPFLAEERNLINMLAEMLRIYFVRKGAAEQILKEKNLSDSVINSMPGVFYFYDHTGRLIRWNKRLETVTGYSGEEISNMHPLDFFEGEDKEHIKNRIGEAFEKGISNAEALFLTKNKTKVPYYFTGATIEIDGVPYLLGTGIDITERKKAEEELRISEQKYKLLFENNPLPIIMFSTINFAIIDVNESAIRNYGYAKEEFLQMSIKDLRPPEDILKFLEKIITPIMNDGWLGTWKHKKKDGTIIDVEISGHEIIYRDIPVRLVLCNDVTEKLKAQENLKKSYEEIRLLASNIENIREEEKIKIAREIHDELGQQLTGLKMDISWLSKKLNPQETILREKIKEILLLLDETVRSVRRIASELRPGLLDDLGLVAAIEWQSEEFEKRSGIKIQFRHSVKDEMIPTRLSTGLFRIFQESLTNVARHAEAHKIIATLEQDNDQIILQIRDDGKGFDATEIKNKKTLGLLGMKERTMMMGGKYEIVSEPGMGTTVIVSVLLAKDNDQKINKSLSQ